MSNLRLGSDDGGCCGCLILILVIILLNLMCGINNKLDKQKELQQAQRQHLEVKRR